MRQMAGTLSGRFGRISILLLLPCLLISVAGSQTVRVDITPGHAANSFVPTEALGAGIDRIETATTDKMFVEPVIKQVLSAGWQTVTYRQNTELHVEAWHWNPQGAWSDPGGKRLFRRQREAGRAHPPLVRILPAPSRVHPQRRHRHQRLFPDYRWRSETPIGRAIRT